MESIINSFIEAYNNSNHISKLIKNEAICISFDVNDSAYFLTLTKQQASASKLPAQEIPFQSVRINGDFHSITEILKGSIKLRDAIASGIIETGATFRTILLLETIFFLTNRGYQTRLIDGDVGQDNVQVNDKIEKIAP